MSVFFPCSHASLLSCSRRVVFLSLFLSRSFIGRRVQALYYSQIIVMTLIYEFDVSLLLFWLCSVHPYSSDECEASGVRHIMADRHLEGLRRVETQQILLKHSTYLYITKLCYSFTATFTNNNMFFFSPPSIWRKCRLTSFPCLGWIISDDLASEVYMSQLTNELHWSIYIHVNVMHYYVITVN